MSSTLSHTTPSIATGTTRGLYTLVGATLIAASMFPAEQPKYGTLHSQRNPLVFGSKEANLTPDTLQFTKAEQFGQNVELIDALDGVLRSLVQAQAELDPDTQRLLHSKLWDLYE
jgi:hypothetical protein